MAITTLPAIPVIYTVEDVTGSKSRVQTYLPAATTLLDATTKAEATLALLRAVSGGAVTGYSITIGAVDPLAPAPAAGSRVEQKALFIFRTAAGKTAQVSIPAIKDSLVNSNGGITTANIDVAALVADLLGSGYCDSNGSDLAALVQDYEVFRSTTRSQRTTDTTPTA